MDALRGGALVPELFTYAIGSITSAEDLPHNNPAIVAKGDAEVDRRWRNLAARLGGSASPATYLWHHYEETALACERPDYRLGYIRFRQAELLQLDGAREAALRMIYEALYAEVCAPRVSMDFYADPPRWVMDEMRPDQQIGFPSAWQGLALDLIGNLDTADDGLATLFMRGTERWAGNPLCQNRNHAWQAVAAALDRVKNHP
ncbi:hypothetical protein [Brevundimonas bullata]|uniref:hypothetical protein n=1 Tax=Brevundimonas bullata TaxID=13160 RepID=UPI003D9A4772